MGVLVEAVVADLGKAEHPLDDADGLLRTLDLLRFFRRSFSSDVAPTLIQWEAGCAAIR